MKEIAEFENANANGNLINQNINPTLFRAYLESKCNNNMIDFSWCVDIRTRDVEDIANNCKLYGITEFTISDSPSNLTVILALFEKQGFYITGMTNVKTTGNISVPAIRLKYLNDKEKR